MNVPVAPGPASTPAASPGPASCPAARVDLFGSIHKSLRRALGDMLVQLGAADLASAATVNRLHEELGQVLDFAELHRVHEDTFLLPALAERLHGKLESMRAAHDMQPVMVAELKALADALRAADDGCRPVAGRTLYLNFSTFIAELFLHMAEEEHVLQPLLERHFTDGELLAIHGQLLASMSMQDKAVSARRMLPALNPQERAALLAGVAASSPPEVVNALLDVARSVLSEPDYSDLLARSNVR